jgi:hypothetical protein
MVALAGEIPGVRRRTLIDSIKFLKRIVGSPKPMILFFYIQKGPWKINPRPFFIYKRSFYDSPTVSIRR